MTRLALKAFAIFLLLSCMAVAVAAETDEYRLGYEDIIVLTVMGHDELSGEFYVPTDGFINVPRVGQVYVKGKTLVEVSKLVEDGMKKFLISPDVSIKLKTARPQNVYVMGAVRQTGSFDIKPGWRITEAIGAAGGMALGVETADCTVSVLSKATGQKRSLRLAEVMKGDAVNNPLVEAGDVITVEAVETFPVYVMGKVQRPGLYNLRKDNAGLFEALTMAGGASDDAGLAKVTVTHLDGLVETVNIVPVTLGDKQESPAKLRSGDLVNVPDSTARFAVLGSVNSPGFYPMKENQRITLSDAIGLAKGADNMRGQISKVAVLRNQDGKQQRFVYDLGKFLKKGDVTQNPEIQAGDIVFVPRSNKISFNEILSAASGAASLLWSVDRLAY